MVKKEERVRNQDTRGLNAIHCYRIEFFLSNMERYGHIGYGQDDKLHE